MFMMTKLRRESKFAECKEAADHSLASPLFTNSKATKASLPLARGRKVAVRFIATRHLPRYRSARGVVRHRDIFSDPTMPKAGESPLSLLSWLYCQRIGKAYHSALTSESSLHCRQSSSGWQWRGRVHARHQGVVATEGEGMIGTGRPSTKLFNVTRGYFVRPIEGLRD